jgi:hypothetical protein
VGGDTGATSSASSLSVGVLAGTFACVEVTCVEFEAQEGNRMHRTRIGTSMRFIWQSIAGKN